MAVPRAWFLNFDADLELAAPGGYTSPRATELRHAELVLRARGLVPNGDAVVIGPCVRDVATMAPTGLTCAPLDGISATTEGRAFCPTPRAMSAFRLAGVAEPAAPALAVLRRVNHRRFCAELGQTLPGASMVRSLDELRAVLQSAQRDWLLKRVFAFSGRGQRRVPDGACDEATLRFAENALRAGQGLQVEPLVARLLDVALHGFVLKSGALVLGEPTVQIIDDRGSWQGSARANPSALRPSEREHLAEETARVGAALHSAGYFGPYGVDAFRWTTRDGATQFNPRCEINARYSMGWAVGMGDRRPDLEPSARW